MKAPLLRRPLGVMLLIAFASLASGCAFAPGGHIAYDVKGDSLHESISVLPITVDTIRRFGSAQDFPPEFRSSVAEVPELDVPYDYLIGRGDVLNIIVYDHPELTIPAGSERSAAESGNVVHSDGTIFYPYIGTVQVAGRTVRDVRDEIQARLKDYIAQPQVDVKVAAFNAQKIYVTGQVAAPGVFPVTNVPMRVLDALSLAGGPTEAADWHQLVLSRDGRDIKLSLYNMLTYSDLQQNLLLRSGDVLHVPDVVNQQVYVMGEVSDPMALPMGNSRLSLTDAVSRAGGIREATADASGIFVVRQNPPESETFATVYQLDARNAAAFVLGSRFMLQPRDLVYVTAAPVSRWNRVLAQLLPSLTSIYQATEIGENVDNIQTR